MANILDSAYYIDDVKPSPKREPFLIDDGEHDALHVGKPQGPQ